MSERRMRVEALIASPPTEKCEIILAMLDELQAAHPGELLVDVYLAGEQPGSTPTKGYQDKGKFKRVPSLFVNGVMVCQAEVPERGELERILALELAKGPQRWMD